MVNTVQRGGSPFGWGRHHAGGVDMLAATRLATEWVGCQYCITCAASLEGIASHVRLPLRALRVTTVRMEVGWRVRRRRLPLTERLRSGEGFDSTPAG